MPSSRKKSISKAQKGVQGMITTMKAEQEKESAVVPKQSENPYKFATPAETKLEQIAPAEREIASKKSFDMMDGGDKLAYLSMLITNTDFDSKLSKGDIERIDKVVLAGKKVTEPQERFLGEVNDKLLKKHNVEGYGIMAKPKHQIQMKIAEVKKSADKGKRITFGCGGFLKQTLTVSPETVEEFTSIPAEKSYARLGRYLVNKHRLRDNQLIMRTVKGGQIMGLPSMTVSPKLGKMINKIVSGRGFPSHDELGEMCDSDKDIMYKIFKMSKAEGLESLPKSTLKNKQERDFNEFTIAKGELMAGNNSPELVKKFKTLLLRLMNDGQIVRREGHDILMDLTALGF